MKRKDLHHRVLMLLEQGKLREEIVAEMKQTGLEDDPYADFDAIAARVS